MTAPLQRRGSSFFLPMLLLPREKRQAMQALYYFCRAADDAVDEAGNPTEARKQLHYWKQQLEWIYNRKAASDIAPHPITPQLAEAVQRYDMPRRYFDDMLSGLELDCQPRVRLADEEALNDYCYRVAGCVGLQAMRIFGHPSEAGEAFAVTLGRALQLTNILRDLKEDAAENRCYLPQRWLWEAGLGKANPCQVILQDQLPSVVKQRLVEASTAAFSRTSQLAYFLPTHDILPALLMRDIYHRKLKYLRKPQAKPPSKIMELTRILWAACRYRLSPIN